MLMRDATPRAGYDRAVVDIGLEWLTQYARFLRRSPELVAGLAERDADFELVPIPRLLLDQLAVPGLVGSGQLGDAGDDADRLADVDALFHDRAVAEVPPEAIDVVRRFASAIAHGDAAAVRALLCNAFIDPDGRSADDVSRRLADLFDGSGDRGWTVHDVAATSPGGAECVFRVNGTWRAVVPGAVDVTEDVALDVIAGPDAEGVWRIRSIRSA
jgi:hypothetical protein